MYVDILILSGIIAGPKHGYEIKKNVQTILGSGFSINNNALYPALRKFEEMGAIEKEVQQQKGKPNRHIYRATQLGEEILQEMLREFPEEMADNEAEFEVRVGLFNRVDEATRLDILAKRKLVLEKRLAHFNQLNEMYLQYRNDTFQFEMVRFLKERDEHELKWIHELMAKVGELT